MTMRTILLASLLAFTQALPGGQAATNHAESRKGDLACIEDMQVPLYDGLLWVARASGSFRASIAIGSDSTSTRVNVDGKPGLIQEMLKSALGQARFSRHCSGQALELSFVYRLEGKADKNPHTQLRFKGANTFEITASPPPFMPPQPSGTRSETQ